MYQCIIVVSYYVVLYIIIYCTKLSSWQIHFDVRLWDSSETLQRWNEMHFGIKPRKRKNTFFNQETGFLQWKCTVPRKILLQPKRAIKNQKVKLEWNKIHKLYRKGKSISSVISSRSGKKWLQSTLWLNHCKGDDLVWLVWCGWCSVGSESTLRFVLYGVCWWFAMVGLGHSYVFVLHRSCRNFAT